MRQTPGRQGTNPFDPTAQRASNPVPDDDDILGRENRRRGETPRRYDLKPEDEAVMLSRALKTRV
jgi:hypothetical protein